MNTFNKTDSVVFLYSRFTLFVKDLFFSKLVRGRNSLRCFCVELVKHLSVYHYSVDIFFIFWSFRNNGF